jgi:outer membrane protein OmpA-like peptidoglycan-associated protein
VTKVVPAAEGRIYFIDRGIDASIKVGDVLNVFRDIQVRSAGSRKSLRVQLGTMAIVSSETGVSLGRFIPAAGLDEDPMIRMKTPVKNDLVIPKLKIDASVLFDAGAATLQAQVVKEELDKVVDFVRSFNPSKLTIEGHTDSDGDEGANQTLSELRAEMIMNYLINNYEEIRPAMITARGYGETRPIVTNDTPENRALNRRIEIVVLE